MKKALNQIYNVLIKIPWLLVICLGVLTLVINKTVGIGVIAYNTIVSSYEQAKKSVGDLDSEYQRRYALVDNLVSIVKEVKGFEKYLVEVEKDIYVKTAEAKASATKMDIKYPEKIKDKINKENKLTEAISAVLDKMLVLAQKFPEIKDPKISERSDTFYALTKLKQDLKAIETEILYARKSLNEYVRIYNQNVSIFPSNLIAKQFGFNVLPYFETISDEARKDVKIQF